MPIHTRNIQDIRKMFTNYFNCFMDRSDFCAEAFQLCRLFGVDSNEELHDVLLADMIKLTQFFTFWLTVPMESDLYRLLCDIESCVITLNPSHTRVVPETRED